MPTTVSSEPAAAPDPAGGCWATSDGISGQSVGAARWHLVGRGQGGAGGHAAVYRAAP